MSHEMELQDVNKDGMGDELDEWEIIDEDKKDEEEKLELETPTGEEKPQQKRKLKFKFFEYTKNKLYNIAKSYPRESIAKDKDTVLLGEIYFLSSQENGKYEFDRFLQKFQGLIWFTYRNNFPQIINTDITSDLGWGCMLRSAQMMLANAFLFYFNSQCQSTGNKCQDETDSIEDIIINWFTDYPGITHPLSIHNILLSAQSFNVKPGDWVGPTTISLIVEQLLKKYSVLSFSMYVCKESTIYLNEVMNIACYMDECGDSNKSSASITEVKQEEAEEDPKQKFPAKFKPIILSVPLRLGISNINTCFYPTIKRYLSSPFSIGIIGGKQHSALYFIGFQDDDLIYLDPHYVQSSLPEGQNPINKTSYHSKTPHKMPLKDVDPSLSIAFLLQNENELEEFCNLVRQNNLIRDEVIFEIQNKPE